MPLDAASFDAFMKLLEPTAERNEVECARFLDGATLRLFPESPKAELTVSFEERMHFGRSDYLVVGDFISNLGKPERRVYFWEVKAAQCFLARRDDANSRVRPTTDLIKAETQLIHYAYEARGSQAFLRKYGVISENVRMGGIIIGRDDRIWDPVSDINPLDAELSFNLRVEQVYDRMNLSIITWDRIADVLRPHRETGGDF